VTLTLTSGLQVKLAVDKLPRNQRKESLKMKMNSYQETKTKDVSRRRDGTLDFQGHA